MIPDPSLNMVSQFLRSLGGRTIVAQMRGDQTAKSLSILRADMNEQLGDKMNAVFTSDKYALRPADIDTEGYTWCAHLIPEEQVFLRGLPRWSFCVAGYLRGKIHKALVFEPHTGNFFVALAKRGAFEKAKRMHFSARKDLRTALLALHVSSVRDVSRDILVRRRHAEPALGKESVGEGDARKDPVSAAELSPPIALQLLGATGGFVNSGSWLLDFLDCAAGRLDIFYGMSLSPELIEVAELFVGQIGGMLESGDISHSGPTSLLVSNTYLFEELQELLFVPSPPSASV